VDPKGGGQSALGASSATRGYPARSTPAGSTLKTYVVQIAKYTCIEFLRKKIRFSAVDLDSIDLADANPGPEQEVAAAERQEQAAKALAQLPEGCRQLFEMIFEHKLPYQEISRRLGVAEGTVKSRAWRCRELLMKRLGTKR
jgi:RNA polymerase sigma-70 factor (ECF subfamily)